MEMTEEQTKLLAGFALEIMQGFPDLLSLDGYEIQDLAVKHKLLIPRTVYCPCGDDCNCATYYDQEEWQDGVTCYNVAEWLTRAAEHRNEAEGEQGGASPTEDDVVTVGRVQDERHTWQ